MVIGGIMTVYSYSRLTSFHNCQYGYYLNYILKMPSRQNIYGFLGGIIHELLEQLQVNAITNSEAVERFNKALYEADELGYFFPTLAVELSFTKSIRNYLSSFKPHECTSCEIEKEFHVNVDGVELLGYIDLVLVNEDGSVTILDHKSSSKFTKADLPKNGRQLIIYAIALQDAGYVVDKLGWSMLKYATVRVGTNRSKVVTRDKIGVQFFNQLKALVEELPIPEEFQHSMLEHLHETGRIEDLPTEIIEQVQITPLIVEYPLTDENIQEVKDFIVSTAKAIESKSDEPDEWEHKKIDERSSFFCNTLCGQRDNCKHWIAYRDRYKQNQELAFLESLFD